MARGKETTLSAFPAQPFFRSQRNGGSPDYMLPSIDCEQVGRRFPPSRFEPSHAVVSSEVSDRRSGGRPERRRGCHPSSGIYSRDSSRTRVRRDEVARGCLARSEVTDGSEAPIDGVEETACRSGARWIGYAMGISTRKTKSRGPAAQNQRHGGLCGIYLLLDLRRGCVQCHT